MAKEKTASHFADRVVAAVKKRGSPVCVGLDPRWEHIPGSIKRAATKDRGETAEAIADTFVVFNKGIIDAVFDLVPAVKPQFAFYIQYGAAGVRAFEETCAYAQSKGLLVIADAKCNDIGSTAEAYAQGFLERMECDALTVNPYLGYDGVKPFIEICRKRGKGIFVLVKTSNPSSGDLQDRITEDKVRNYELMARYVESWGADELGSSGYSSVGAVAGATFPAEAAKLRVLMPTAYFLVPGYGAQGGSAADVAVCFNKDGLGALVNSSRDIIFAWEKEKPAKEGAVVDGKNFGEAARRAVERMCKDLSEAL